MGAKIGIVLLTIFAVGVFLYLEQAGVLTKLLDASPFQRSTSTTDGKSTSTPFFGIFRPASPPVPPPTGGSPPPPSPVSPPAIDPRQIPEGFTIDQISPHFRRVRISGVTPGSGTAIGRIALYGQMPEGIVLNVSGWRLQANRGSQIVPRAVHIYDPSGFTSESAIVLKNGETVNMYSSTSAVGVNFRLNKCIGYLANHATFDPPLNQNCPARDLSEISSFTGQCQNYIRSLGGCREPADNPPVPSNDFACRDYLTRINYRGCFEDHASDADFLGKEWRVWMGSKFLDQFHDRVLLLDAQGLLVDSYTY